MPCDEPPEARDDAGTTLVELLVVLAIVSILAVVAIPMAETVVQRRAELELREALRTTRRAIDAFHDDWAAERMAEDEEAASGAGYPVTVEALVAGVELATDPPERRRYLRRLPENPFGGRVEPQGLRAGPRRRRLGRGGRLRPRGRHRPPRARRDGGSRQW